MKKFKFTLQTVHNVREMRQEKEEFVLSQLLAEAERTAARIAELERRQHEAIENYAARMRQGAAINICEVELERDHIAALDRLIRETRGQLEQQQAGCRQQTQKVAAAMREVKITDQLRDTQKSRHERERSREEQNTLDDLISAGFARRMS
jgi:flagellar export protein FliJ